MPRTKIVATIGPASSKPEIICSMLDAGMTVAQYQLSRTATMLDTQKTIQMLREVCCK